MRSILYYSMGWDSLHPSRLSRTKLVYEGRIRSVRGWPVDVQDQLGLVLALTDGLVRSLSG